MALISKREFWSPEEAVKEVLFWLEKEFCRRYTRRRMHRSCDTTNRGKIILLEEEKTVGVWYRIKDDGTVEKGYIRILQLEEGPGKEEPRPRLYHREKQDIQACEGSDCKDLGDTTFYEIYELLGLGGKVKGYEIRFHRAGLFEVDHGWGVEARGMIKEILEEVLEKGFRINFSFFLQSAHHSSLQELSIGFTHPLL